jgi:Flp pilus assembly protein TadB
MAQTKRKRRSKHRGTAAGSVEARGRTGRKPRPEEIKRDARAQARRQRLNKAPTWRSAATRAAITSVILFPVLLFLVKHAPIGARVAMCVFAFLIYVPLGYYTDLFIYRRRQKKEAAR